MGDELRPHRVEPYQRTRRLGQRDGEDRKNKERHRREEEEFKEHMDSVAGKNSGDRDARSSLADDTPPSRDRDSSEDDIEPKKREGDGSLGRNLDLRT